MRQIRGQATQLRPGEKVDNRGQSPEQAAKSSTGEKVNTKKKVDNRQQSQGQAAKSRTGVKVDNCRESPEQAKK